MNDHAAEEKFNLDWRIVFGISVSTIWIGAGLFYLLVIVGGTNFVYLPTADIGSFLEGAFAPLAFLWLVIGHFMQQKEITANTMAISLQEKSARRLELHSQRDSYFKLLNLVQGQLGSIAAFQYMSVCGPTGTSEISNDEFAEQRARTDNTDHAWFVRKMIGVALRNMSEPVAMRDVFLGTEVRERHSRNYLRTFEKLLENAKSVDTDDMICDALLYGSAVGMLYRIIRHASGEDALNPFTGLAGGPVELDHQEA
ncbi:MAG: hypothetical protein KJP25_03580 [Gammaproteobacteria bacterium]|nr:hypothetical protein [Gammaproteobacteria bacterium]MBT8151869.1 hypothetical protein [Gammaproteobacteria bacterium]NND40068.1 hypothetical protein [Pseudomonadales bacterium]NNM11308.1 hypothetical protein [Pseudomonadales bacterium]